MFELERHRPFWGIGRLHNHMDRVFHDFLRSPLNIWEGLDGGSDTLVPAIDIADKKEEIVLHAELPGVEKDDMSVTVEGGTLILKGEKKHETEEKDDGYTRRERYFGSFSRSLTLPDNVDPDKIKASFKDGVLTIKLPKVKESKPKEVSVEVE